MHHLKNLTPGQLIFQAVVGYGTASFVSYKYNLMTKAQEDLKDIDDKKMFLMERHQAIAESFDADMAQREWSNKLPQYRKVLLSYAEGDVLECGIGTGTNL